MLRQPLCDVRHKPVFYVKLQKAQSRRTFATRNPFQHPAVKSPNIVSAICPARFRTFRQHQFRERSYLYPRRPHDATERACREVYRDGLCIHREENSQQSRHVLRSWSFNVKERKGKHSKYKGQAEWKRRENDTPVQNVGCTTYVNRSLQYNTPTRSKLTAS